MKERHDNFSFEKVLKTKNEVYNTMHFQGIREHNPNLILFMKQGAEVRLTRDYSNEKY